MSSDNDRSVAPAEALSKPADSFSDVIESASLCTSDEAYREMDWRRLPNESAEGPTRNLGDNTRLTTLAATQTVDKPEGKDKGVIDLDADGKGKVKYDPNQRNDRMSASSEVRTADGKSTTREYEGRSDGMTSLVTTESRGARSDSRTFDSSKSKSGILGEQIVASQDGMTTVSRTFDPSRSANRLRSEEIKDTPASTQTDKFFAYDSSNPLSIKSTSTTLDKATGAERKTFQLVSGNSVQRDKAGPNAKAEVKEFDANGKPVTKEVKPSNDEEVNRPGSGNAVKKPESGEQRKDRPGAENNLTKDQKLEKDLAAYRETLEKDNKLPPLKAGQGPYQAIQAGIKAGIMPQMGHKEILKEARRIRDRDKAAERGHYRVGERLEIYSKAEIEAKVTAERKRLQPEKPEQPKPEQPKTEQPKPEQPKPEQPKTEQPKTEQPKTEQPKTEQPKPEQPKPEQPKTEQPKTEQPRQEQPKTEQPKTEQPKPEQPRTEQPKTEQPKAEQPKPELPKTEQPKVEQPKVELPKPEQPRVLLPRAEQPRVLLPRAEQPKAELPKAEQPRVELPKAEQPKAEKLEPKQPGDNATEKKTVLQVENNGASKEFVERIQKEVDKLPEGVKKALLASGARVVVGKSVLEIMPELKDQKPRGHLPGTGWENLDGLHDPGQNRIVVAETRIDNGQVVNNNRAEGVLKHETGHALDRALGGGSDFSQSEEFKKAYTEDVSKIANPLERARLQYLLNEGGGSSETFAEVFGALHGSSANASQTPMILEKFPSVAKVIQERIAKLEKSMSDVEHVQNKSS